MTPEAEPVPMGASSGELTGEFTIFSCGACYRCISIDILPATCRCAGAGCPSACTTDCQSASTWPSRPTVGRIGHVLGDRLSVG